MCGIIAYLQKKSDSRKISENLLKGLRQLQNRGYDSAGIILFGIDHYELIKKASDSDKKAINYLEDKLNILLTNDNIPEFQSGIGHTRWATHGGKTDENAHPHLDQNGHFALVHNGIIENYQSLKLELIEEGFQFKSETDTEVIVNLISSQYQKTNDLKKAVQTSIQKLEGTWGLVILNLMPNLKQSLYSKLFLARRGSPLLVSYDNDYIFVASEESGFCQKVSEFIPLKDNDLLCFEETSLGFQLIYLDGISEDVKKHRITRDLQTILPPHYSHWTLKEIWETPISSLRALNCGGRIESSHQVKLGGLEFIKDDLLKKKHLVLLGCGTSYHAALLALKYFYELDYSGFKTILALDASEFEESHLPHVPGEEILLIHLSQSGETRDLQKCIELGKKKHILQLGVVNVVDSLIAREVDAGCYINAGREVGVASTKSFLNQVIVLAMIAIWFAQNQSNNKLTELQRKTYIKDLRRIPLDLEKTLQLVSPIIEKIAEQIRNSSFKSLYLLGKGQSGVALAKEGALKIKELVYFHAEGSSAISLKHGPFGLLEKGYPIILIALGNPPSHIAKIHNAFQEILSREADIYLITDLSDYERFKGFKELIRIPENSSFQELVATIPLQLLSYYMSLQEGNDPDYPRNLAKVVTVE